jgi:arabinoxylan arabinofuranohydrolase
MNYKTKKRVIRGRFFMAAILTAVLASANFTSLGAASENELSENGTFETGEISPWQAYDGTLLTAASSGYDSKYCMEISNRPNVWNAPLQTISNKLTAGEVYIVSAQVKADTAGTYSIALEEPYSANGYDVCETESFPAEAGKWTEISGEITLTAGFSTANVVFLVKRTNDTKPYYIDNVSLKPQKPGAAKPKTQAFTPEADPYVIPQGKAQAYNTTNLKLTEAFTFNGEEVKNAINLQSYCADPTAIEADGKLYVYGTRDQKSYGNANNPSLDKNAGTVLPNKYQTDKLSIFSTTDLVNWTDEGYIDMKELGVSWANRSWAPSICRYPVGGGKYCYYLFFTNSGNVGYLKGETPLGPWKDERGSLLIDKSKPELSSKLAGVYWNFDPSVLVDDKNNMYVYWGGGNVASPSAEQYKHPKSSRAAKVIVSPDKLELDINTITEQDAYYIFEDSEINQIDGKYVYTYCTNWNVPGGNKLGIGGAQIAGYVSDNPLKVTADPENPKPQDAKYMGQILTNPGGALFGHWYNNHHRITKFKGEYYMLYHTPGLDKFLYKNDPVYQANSNGSFDYRNLHIDKITTLNVTGANPEIKVTPTLAGPKQVGSFNAYQTISAATQSMMAGLSTKMLENGKVVLDKIDTGDWTRIDGVDFGKKEKVKLEVSLSSETVNGSIEVYLDKPLTGKKIADIALVKTGADKYETLEANIGAVSGVHDVYFVFRGAGYNVASWTFSDAS